MEPLHRAEDNARPLEPLISIRIITLDHYLAYPNPLTDHCATQFSAPGAKGFKVPIIRIFGVTENGQKACVHVHQAYPYIYIPYDGPLDPQGVRLYIHKLGTSLNHATALALGQNQRNTGKSLYIASIILVKGIPFYGFHAEYQFFLKINLLNPNLVNRIVAILESGSVLGKAFQPFEAHIPYLHQFFIDYNLYGMDFMRLADARFRMPILDISRGEHPLIPLSGTQIFKDEHLDGRYKWPSRYGIRRQSYCELELDTWVTDILNRHTIEERPATALVDIAKGQLNLEDTKLVPSLAAIWQDERDRRLAKGLEANLSMNATPFGERLPYSPWSNEERLRDQIRRACGELDEHRKANGQARSVQQSVSALMDDVLTAFQSVPAVRADRVRPIESGDDASRKEQQLQSSPVHAGNSLSAQDYSQLFDDVEIEVDIDRITQAFPSQQSQGEKEAAEILDWMANGQDEDEMIDQAWPDQFQRENFEDGGEDRDSEPQDLQREEEEELEDLSLIYDDPRTPTSTPAKSVQEASSVTQRTTPTTKRNVFLATSPTSPTPKSRGSAPKHCDPGSSHTSSSLPLCSEQRIGTHPLSRDSTPKTLFHLAAGTPWSEKLLSTPRDYMRVQTSFDALVRSPVENEIDDRGHAVGESSHVDDSPVIGQQIVSGHDREERLTDSPTSPRASPHTSFNRRIPQVDGAGDTPPTSLLQKNTRYSGTQDSQTNIADVDSCPHDVPLSSSPLPFSAARRKRPIRYVDDSSDDLHEPNDVANTARPPSYRCHPSRPVPRSGSFVCIEIPVKRRRIVAGSPKPLSSSHERSPIHSVQNSSRKRVDDELCFPPSSPRSVTTELSGPDDFFAEFVHENPAGATSILQNEAYCDALERSPVRLTDSVNWSDSSSDSGDQMDHFRSQSDRDESVPSSTYFTSSILGMWSPPAVEEIPFELSSFICDPPSVGSPSELPNQKTFLEETVHEAARGDPEQPSSHADAPQSVSKTVHFAEYDQTIHGSDQYDPGGHSGSPMETDSDSEGSIDDGISSTTAEQMETEEQEVATKRLNSEMQSLVSETKATPILDGMQTSPSSSGSIVDKDRQDPPPCDDEVNRDTCETTSFAGGNRLPSTLLMEAPPSRTHLQSFVSQLELAPSSTPSERFSLSAEERHSTACYRFAPPPSADELVLSLATYDIPKVLYREPHFSNPLDVPPRPKVFAGREFKFKPEDTEHLSEFDTSGCHSSTLQSSTGVPGELIKGLAFWKEEINVFEGDRSFIPSSLFVWTLASCPPSRTHVMEWLKNNPSRKETNVKGDVVVESEPIAAQKSLSVRRKPEDVSQIEAPTPKNPYGFKYSQINVNKVHQEKEYICTMSLELHARSREDFMPDPRHDPVCAVFYCLQNEDERRYKSNGHRPGSHVGVIMIQDDFHLNKTGISGYVVDSVSSEKDLFEKLVDRVRSFDPDLLIGYEIHNSSWGYLVERARVALDIDLCTELSRVLPDNANTKFGRDEDSWGFRKQSHLHCTGRIFLNVWRLMRSELNLTSYSLESTAYHVLHKRVPKYAHRTLTEWYDKGMLYKWRTIKYYISRTQYNVELLEDTQMISRTSEFARVFGIDFYSVITRGSQFKVESIMARIVKPENFIMVSPSRKQVAAQRACECIPLVMEPQSRFYNSPLLVLDFQSLYPSVMIAYNYCYSTCLGRIQSVGKPHKFGVLDDFEVPVEFVEMFKDHLNVSPNGLVFVQPHIREGTLRRMLSEILDTRVMVKQSMKIHKDDKAVLRTLEARQLGLKFIANVTYGYTGASFSGRMPCVDIADAIVQTGRATLEKAIERIHSTAKWGAKVVYGDTDSLFVYLPNVSKDDAFRIGKDIVDTITKMNPEPVKLKFEKVYHPCVLLAKKRYVGFKYESPDEKEPGFDAKGIETVRRDGCPAVAKTMEQCLKILFRTQDLSRVKEHLYRQWTKILSGRVSIQDFIIAKEVKLGTYSARGPPPPGALISTKKMAVDGRSEPQYGERVPYVVVHGGPGYRLIDSVVPPEELLNSRTLQLHGTYYITRQIIPALSRVFALVGADVESWFNEMPKVQRAIQFTASQMRPELQQQLRNGPGQTIDQYYVAKHCLVCHELTHNEICGSCARDPQTSASKLARRISESEKRYIQLQRVCRSCSGHSTALDLDSACISLDCPVYYARVKAKHGVKLNAKILNGMEKLGIMMEEQ
ncbi:DNA polymerase (pol2) [Spizellomyces punctatus DAOM BR117]|uniref:DNA polymerase zeta catalytic subunit n=1 Tax=Spizellomyces punctatus (strain DAOM BR117) TaxID=645134 RepID=A0A0L0H612_SPIPD|nr:DNA polymerase (pol2) [Spizellomyces punctatus DAOM BR117]KNC96642.1 DNA polymerase (pol2) [Spizellomyces punctatus DAOM BR117]|eukprot:XP_016604682.1 DNA polymerase (pol2) [Spizellomyces punctatus DAOM BR117]